jgi:hypothetical protein
MAGALFRVAPGDRARGTGPGVRAPDQQDAEQ